MLECVGLNENIQTHLSLCLDLVDHIIQGYHLIAQSPGLLTLISVNSVDAKQRVAVFTQGLSIAGGGCRRFPSIIFATKEHAAMFFPDFADAAADVLCLGGSIPLLLQLLHDI